MQSISDISQIQNADNLLVSTDSFMGNAIQHFQRCEFNHSGKFIWLYGILYVCESAKRGICLTPFKNYTDNPQKYTLLIQKPKQEFTNDEIQNMFDFALQRCGHIRYEFINLFVYQPIKFLTLGKVWLGAKTPHEADKSYICGEWCARLYNIGKGWFEKEWERVAPIDLYKSEYFNNYTFTSK